MKSLTTLTPSLFHQWRQQAELLVPQGQLPTYIPRLQNVNPHLMAIDVWESQTEKFGEGEIGVTFPLMSVIKPFLLLYLLSVLGEEAVFARVGQDQSDYPYNSLEQLRIDGGFPRNPMINSGAITLADLVSGESAVDRCEGLQQWLNQQGQCALFLDQEMLASVQSLPNPRNRALVTELTANKHLESPELALNTYNRICCLSGTVKDLAQLGGILIQGTKDISARNCNIVLNLMKTCGLYEHSTEFAKKVEFPTKSGVSGGVLSVVPQQGAIAIYSPPLDAQGNSIAGLFILEQIANYLNVSS